MLISQIDAPLQACWHLSAVHQHRKKCSSMESLFALRARRDLNLASGWQVVVSVDSPLHHWRSHSLLDRHRRLDCPQRRRWVSISSVCQRELSVQQADKWNILPCNPFNARLSRFRFLCPSDREYQRHCISSQTSDYPLLPSALTAGRRPKSLAVKWAEHQALVFDVTEKTGPSYLLMVRTHAFLRFDAREKDKTTPLVQGGWGRRSVGAAGNTAVVFCLWVHSGSPDSVSFSISPPKSSSGHSSHGQVSYWNGVLPTWTSQSLPTNKRLNNTCGRSWCGKSEKCGHPMANRGGSFYGYHLTGKPCIRNIRLTRHKRCG